MRLESQIIEDQLVEGFNELEEAIVKLDKAKKYVSRIKNKAKREYAEKYLNYLSGKGEEPEEDKGLSFMARQAVRMQLQDLTEGLMLEAPIHAKGWTQASVAKFGKTIGKDPQEHGFFDACVSRMEGKTGFDNDKAKRFCASIKDASYGSAYWRGKEKPKEKIEKDVKAKQFPRSKQLKKGKKLKEGKLLTRLGKELDDIATPEIKTVTDAGKDVASSATDLVSRILLKRKEIQKLPKGSKQLDKKKEELKNLEKKKAQKK